MHTRRKACSLPWQTGRSVVTSAPCQLLQVHQCSLPPTVIGNDAHRTYPGATEELGPTPAEAWCLPLPALGKGDLESALSCQLPQLLNLHPVLNCQHLSLSGKSLKAPSLCSQLLIKHPLEAHHGIRGFTAEFSTETKAGIFHLLPCKAKVYYLKVIRKALNVTRNRHSTSANR